MYIIQRIIVFLLNSSEGLLLSQTKFLAKIVEIVPPSILMLIGRMKALNVFETSVKHVPAYSKFIEDNNFKSKVHSYKEFTKIPETTKQNYIYKYGLVDRCIDGKLPFSGNIDESAGSSGKATMWIRSTKEEKKLQRLVDFGMHFTFRSFSRDDLVVLNCWSTGPWATGVKFSQLAQRSSVVKCIGTDKVNIIDTMKTLGNQFEYLISGYPPFVKEILDYGDTVDFPWGEYRINVLTGGEGFSEGWRNYMREKITGSYGEVYSAYGASDIDIGVSFETDFTIKIKQLADQNIEFRKAIFRSEQMPAYFGQYNPMLYHIENTSDGELLFTTLNSDICSPKIRYNLKDSGIAYNYNEVIEILKKYAPDLLLQKKKIHLPFVTIFGRSDGTISLDGANIYPNDVQDALFKSSMAKYVRSFCIDVAYTKDQSMIFKVMVEVSDDKDINEITKEDVNVLEGFIREHLIKANKDYRESYENNPESLSPRVEFFKSGEGIFVENKSRIKNIYYLKK